MRKKRVVGGMVTEKVTWPHVAVLVAMGAQAPLLYVRSSKVGPSTKGRLLS